MNANELRIENWVMLCFDHTPGWFNAQVTEIRSGKTINTDTIMNPGNTSYYFEPIPLTAKWLERAGFEEEEETKWRHESGHHVTLKANGYVYGIRATSLAEIKYVHRLQNLYYALTNQELDFTKK